MKRGLLMLCKTQRTLDEEAGYAARANALGVPFEARVTKEGLTKPLSTGQPLVDIFD